MDKNWSKALHISGDKNLSLTVRRVFSDDHLLKTMEYKSWNYNPLSLKALKNDLVMNTQW